MYLTFSGAVRKVAVEMTVIPLDYLLTLRC